jgi:hypothetical protein
VSISPLSSASAAYRAPIASSRVPSFSMPSASMPPYAASSGSSSFASGSALAPDLALANAARDGSPRGLALEAARTLVSEAFVKPVFAQMQEGSLAAGPFQPGTGERRFRPLLDAALAGKVVESANFDLVERLADRFERAIAPNGVPAT